ncbi:MAG: hypothetical protein ACRD4R_11940 [Candidatus Acidiferrales bacterium]
MREKWIYKHGKHLSIFTSMTMFAGGAVRWLAERGKERFSIVPHGGAYWNGTNEAK